MKSSYNNESAFESDFCSYLKKYGWVTLKMDGVAKGFPDRMVLGPAGEVIFFEFKNPNGAGRISPAQEHWYHKLDQMDQMVAVIATIDEANDILFKLLGSNYANEKMGTSQLPDDSSNVREDDVQWLDAGSGSGEDEYTLVRRPGKDSRNRPKGPIRADVDEGEREVGFWSQDGPGDGYTLS